MTLSSTANHGSVHQQRVILPIIRNSALMIRLARTGRIMPGRAASARNRPMGEMNVTPFIDVLLVLLIMMIMAIPAAFQKTEVPLPSGIPNAFDSVSNTVSIDPQSRLFWNGEPISRQQLRVTVAHASALPDEPQLRFAPSPQANYNTSAQTIALVKDAGATRFAFIGNAAHKDFGK